MKKSTKILFTAICTLPINVLVIWLIYDHIIISKFPAMPPLNYGECFLIFILLSAILSPGYVGYLIAIVDKLYNEENKE